MGGYVYVTTGLLKAADNEAQLASVIAHEIGHTLEPYFYELNDPNFRTYEENLRNGRNPNRAKI